MDSPNIIVARIANGTDPPATIRIAQEIIGKQNDSAPILRASKWSNRSPADSLPIIWVMPTMPPIAAAVVKLLPFARKMGTRLMMSAMMTMEINKVAATRDWKGVVEGKGVARRVVVGGSSIIKKKNKKQKK